MHRRRECLAPPARESPHRQSLEPKARVVLDAIARGRAPPWFTRPSGVARCFSISRPFGVAGPLVRPARPSPTSRRAAPRSPSRLTVTPALSMLLLRRKDGARPSAGTPPLVALVRGRSMKPCCARIGAVPRSGHCCGRLLRSAGAAWSPFFGATFLPDLREGHLILHVCASRDFADESRRIGKLIADALRTVPGRSVASARGPRRGRRRDDGPHPASSRSTCSKALRGAGRVGARNGCASRRPTSWHHLPTEDRILTERIEETVSGFTAAVVVNIVRPISIPAERGTRCRAGARRIAVQSMSSSNLRRDCRRSMTLRTTDLRAVGTKRGGSPGADPNGLPG